MPCYVCCMLALVDVLIREFDNLCCMQMSRNKIVSTRCCNVNYVHGAGFPFLHTGMKNHENGRMAILKSGVSTVNIVDP